MPGLLSHAPPSDEARRRNDTHSVPVVLCVLAVLGVYFYLFTFLGDPFGLPRPQQLLERAGVVLEHVFDEDSNVDSNVGILMAQRYATPEAERLVFGLVLAAAFLSAYFLPLRYKQAALVGWTLVAIYFLHGPPALAGLLAAHFGVYLILHPDARRGRVPSVLAGAAAAYVLSDGAAAESVFLMMAAGAVSVFLAYRYLVLRLLQVARLAAFMRALAVHAALVVIALSVFWNAAGAGVISLSLGFLMFFWQWARLVMYAIDRADGLVPKDISLLDYLAVFISPGVVPNWGWGVTIPQGYAYLANNFLCENKNQIVMSGVRLMLLAIGYLVFWDWLHHYFVGIATGFGVEVYDGYTRAMVRAFVAGEDVGTASVLATTLLDLIRFMMFFAGVVHFKVAVWRLCGYRVEAYYNKPWLATNLVNFWGRFAYHYREFLVRAFYYPVFFRWFKRRPRLRVLLASMAAAGLGNLIWHISERVFFREMDVENLAHVLGTWPYFFLLGLGIGLTQIVLMNKKRTRKPWRADRWWITDVVAVYLTLQYFALIHIFARPVEGGTQWDLLRLFLRGVGVFLPA